MPFKGMNNRAANKDNNRAANKDNSSQKHDALVVRSRKSKGKSRGGCVTCKERRVKCDEIHPTCTRCMGQERPCVYDTIKMPEWRAKAGVFCVSSDSRPRLDAAIPPLKFEDNVFSYAAVFSVPPESVGYLWGYQLTIMPKADLESFDAMDGMFLQHFEKNTSADLLVPQNFWVRDVLKLAFNNSFLMHALLAISVRHLRKIQHTPGSPLDIDFESLETHHLHHALSDFRSILPNADLIANQDALIGTAFTFALYFCSFQDFSPYGRITIEECPCTHLKAIIPIASADRHKARKGAFRYICTPPLFYRNITPTEGPCAILMKRVKEFPPDTPNLDLYIDRIESLTTLLSISTYKEVFTADEADHNLLWILRYGGFIPTEFLQLADAFDPITMVIYAHWFAAAVYNLRFVGNRWWYWQEKPPRMIRCISLHLGRDWADWLEWPNMILERSGFA